MGADSDPTVCLSHSHSHSVISNQTVTLTQSHSLTHSLSLSHSLTQSLTQSQLNCHFTSLHFTSLTHNHIITDSSNGSDFTLFVFRIFVFFIFRCAYSQCKFSIFDVFRFFYVSLFHSLSLSLFRSLTHRIPVEEWRTLLLRTLVSHSFPMIMFRFSDFRQFSHFFTDVRSLQSFCRRRRRCGFIVVFIVLSTVIISFLKLHFCQL